METKESSMSVSRQIHVPTRWGNQLNGNFENAARNDKGCLLCPHSLGKPIEWKLHTDGSFTVEAIDVVPTRWGNQLNGNLFSHFREITFYISPHSLGKPIEWKPLNG